MKKSILFLVAFAALVSCVKENPVEENPAVDTPAVEYQTITFEATAPSASSDDATKTTLVDGGFVHWCKGDAVKVMFIPINGSGAASFPGKAYDGASGVLTSTQEADAAASTSFYTDSWSWGVGKEFMNAGIAVYPSTVHLYSHRQSNIYNSNLPTEISYDLPSVQTAIENSFQNGVAFSYAEIADKDVFDRGEARLQFKNACALIKVTLPATAYDIVSVKVESSNGKLAGKYKVDTNKGFDIVSTYYQTYNIKYPLYLVEDAGQDNVTLTASQGETLKAGATYYIVTWPGSHNDLSFIFTNSLGLTNTKQLAQSVELEASKIDHFNFKNSIEFKHVFEVSQESFDIAGAATSGSFTVTSSRDWTAVSDSDWLTISPASGSASVSAATVTFNAPENTSAERTAKITITAGEDTKVITVTQAQFIAELSIERYGSWNILPAGGDFQFVTIKSNTSWTLSCDQDWLTLGATSGSATAGEIVMLTAAENTTPSKRTATLYLRDNSNTVEKTFIVTQLGVQREYKITTSAPVDGAADLKDGQLYVICNRADASLYWSEADGKLVRASLTTSDTFSNNNVFVFHKDESLVTDEYKKAITYTSRNGGRFSSLSTGKYLDYSFGLNADSSQAQAFLLGNKWANGGNSAYAEPGGEIDIIKGPWSGSEISIVYENGYVFKANGNITNVNTRKWVFYEVTEQ